MDSTSTPAIGVSPRPREAPKETQSLALQARLIALACLLVDLTVFAHSTPHLSIALRLGALLAILCVDAALALPSKYSGHLAVAHVVAAIGLALILQSTPNADWGLAGGIVAAYRAGAWLRRKQSAAALLGLAAAAVVGGSIAYSVSFLTIFTAVLQNACIPWLIGRYTSSRRGYIEELRHNRELEIRDATAAMERSADRLRTAIARDLHDVIAHHVSAIGVHAGAARLKLAAHPEFDDSEIIDSLSAIETSSRLAMLDLRRVLDVLHGVPDTTNQIGLGNLEELFDGVRRSGLDIRFEVRGIVDKLPNSVDIALYRIAQEMLTNALRYSDGTTVNVDLTFEENSVTLRSRNTLGPIPDVDTPLTTGRGLAGIRSRVELFGGEVHYGPVEQGRAWETTVTIRTDGSLNGDTW